MTAVWRVGATPVSMLAADAVTSVRPETTLLDIARVLTDGDIGVVVVRNDDVAGVVSARYLLGAYASANMADND